MKSAYVAARFGRQDEAREVAERLIELGYTITSTWLWQAADEMYDHHPEQSGAAAVKDKREVLAAETMVYLSEAEDNPWGRGGRHVEFGIAVAGDKRLCVVGPLENIFHYAPDVLVFDSIDDLIQFELEEAA